METCFPAQLLAFFVITFTAFLSTFIYLVAWKMDGKTFCQHTKWTIRLHHPERAGFPINQCDFNIWCDIHSSSHVFIKWHSKSPKQLGFFFAKSSLELMIWEIKFPPFWRLKSSLKNKSQRKLLWMLQIHMNP